jgi:hypothetical protein
MQPTARDHLRPTACDASASPSDPFGGGAMLKLMNKPMGDEHVHHHHHHGHGEHVHA